MTIVRDCFLWTGVTFATFHREGWTCLRKHREKRRDSGCDRDLAQGLRTRAGIASGPVAFEQSSCCKWRSTVSGRKCTADKEARHLGSSSGSSSKARSWSPRLHFDAKNFPQHSAFSLLVTHSPPAGSWIVGTDEFVPCPPARLRRDHHCLFFTTTTKARLP